MSFHRSPTSLLLLAVVFLLTSAGDSFARRGEMPFTPVGVGLPKTATLRVDAPDVFALKAEDQAARDAGQKTFRYAEPIPVASGPGYDGTWSTLADGTRMWRLAVVGDDATDINLGFGTYELPHGAKLWVISAQHDYYEGPYTWEDNADHEQLWVPVVPGDEVVVELQLPAETKTEPRLELTHVGYGYTDMFGLASPKQGTCNNDVICPEGDPWRDQIQSVAVYSYGGSTLCTGQMVIDADNTFRPFFLTAYHCGVDGSTAPSMVVYWNFESPVCGQLSGGSLAQNQTGATFRARRQDVDVALVELDELPDPAFNVFYSGWDRSSTPANGSVAIHHPGTDEKAISFNDDVLTVQTSCIGGFTPDTHWRVDNWEDGTTEPGSSGSGIWDPATQLLVGFLSGGLAACGNTEYDCYGRFDVAWDGPSSAARLRDWLDPNGTGGLQVQGAFPSSDGLLTLDAAIPTDDCNGQSDGIIAPGETVSLDVDVTARFGDVTGMSATLASNTAGVTVVDANAAYPDALKDTTVRGLTPFTVALSELVECFSTIQLTATFTDDQGLVFEFPIELTVGQLQGPAGLPVAIPDGSPTGATSTFEVTQDITLTDLNVNVQIQHTYVGDLLIQLTSPAGTTVTLLDRPGVPTSTFGCGDDDMNVDFDDESPQALENYCAGTTPWYVGDAQPATPLSAFDGESSLGTWELFVSDNAGADTGAILDWSLDATPALATGVCEPCAAGPAVATVASAAPGPVSLFLLPDGSGDRFDDAQSWSGVAGEAPVRVDATITVELTDGGGAPIVGAAADAMALGSSAGSLSGCGVLGADGPSDANGIMTFASAPLASGVSDLGAGELLTLAGVDFETQYLGGGDGLDVRFNSADLNGDLSVGLTDVALFAEAYVGEYSYAIDYVWDGSNSIADIGLLASALGSGCPAPVRAASVARTDATFSIEFENGVSDAALAPGEEITARVVARGDAVRRGLTAWEASLVTTDNVRVIESLALGGLDFDDGHDFVVGGDLTSASGEIVVAVLRLAVTDGAPASIGLAAGPVALRGEDAPGVIVRDEGLRTASAGEILARLNDAAPATPRHFALTNHPNPFNPATEIALALPRGGDVEIAIYDVSGRRVNRLALGQQSSGELRVTWRGIDEDGRGVVSGVYFARAFVDGQPVGAPRKMSLLK